MKSCKECGADLLDINETFANESYIYECEECGRWFTEADKEKSEMNFYPNPHLQIDEQLHQELSDMDFRDIVRLVQFMRDDSEAAKDKIKAFFEAFKVGPHPVNEGQIDMVAYDDYGGNPVFREHAGESDEDIARRVALWNLWNAVNSKSG